MTSDLEPIPLIFKALRGFHCFGCASENQSGLKLEVFRKLNDSTHQTVGNFIPREDHCGFPGLLHGGVLATAVDDITFWTFFDQTKRLGLTTGLEIQYKRPVILDGKNVQVRGKLESDDGKTAVVSAVILDWRGNECATGKCTFVTPPQAVLEKVLGAEAVATVMSEVARLYPAKL